MPPTNQRVREFLLKNAREHPADLASFASEHLGMTRQGVNRHLRVLVKQGILIASGATRSRTYHVPEKTNSKVYRVLDLNEDIVWRDLVAPELKDFPANVRDICNYGVTEIVNNAIDHSDGTSVTVVATTSPVDVQLSIADNGVGIFRKIQQACNLEDERHAVLELAKGKLTTDPKRHTGEGIYFTSRMFDYFAILSGRLFFSHTSVDGDWLLESVEASTGTYVTMSIQRDATQTTTAVFDKYTVDERGSYAFDVTHVPVALARHGEENLVSRSQAKRLVARFDRFREVILDFSNVNSIGQAFADQIFRVFAQEHPQIAISVLNAGPAVQQMIRRAEANRASDLGDESNRNST